MASREYHRKYMKTRYHARRALAERLLGGACAHCGATEELEIDHIDARAKTMSTTRMTAVSEERFLAELSKCQLLCRPCHSDKSIKDHGHNKAKGEHGTRSSYRYCRCDACRQAQAQYNKKYYRSRLELKR